MKELDPALYTIAWIAPLEIEAQAALHMLDNRHDGRFPTSRGDDYIFLAGDINGHNIAIATLPAGQEYGTGSAAALASQIKKFFANLWFGLLVGVAAGLPNLRKIPPIDIRLGDVLVGLSEGDSAGLVAYDLGKETTEGFQLLRSGQVLANTETVVRSAIGNIKIRAPDDTDVFLPFYERIKDKEHSRGIFADPGQEKDTFYDIGDDGVDSPVQRMQRPTDRRTRVWYGSIGSGDKLTKNTLKRNGIRDHYEVIGLEMEAAGTMNRIPVGVIRGVCDYADQHKNKEWQPYAAAMAAAYAKAVIYELGRGKAAPTSDGAKKDLCGTLLCDLPPTTDRFFGRDAELLEMIGSLEATTQRKGVVLCGISGSGKTQLAREYVAQRNGKFSAILWIDASSDESVDESFSTCSSRICETTPEFRAGRGSTPPRQLVIEWLRTTPKKNWLTVIDNANGPIPNKRLLGPFQDMGHGSLCVISTNQVTARALRLKQILVEHLDPRASQSLLLWRAYENDTEYEEDGKSPWKQVQALAHSKIKLNRAIDELSKVFLATKRQANDHTLLSFSVHASICQWRLATMEDQDVWIIQATYSLSKHILSLNDKSHIFKFFNLFNRCLHLLWKHIDACHIDIYGKFAEAYFTICLCGADVYLSMGKSEIAKTLFTSAIDYIRSSSPNDPDKSILLRLLCGLAKSCENMREFELAEEALSSAIAISERLNGHMNDQTVGLVSRVKALRDHMLTVLENRKRALVASTGPKLAPPMNSSAESLLEFEDEEPYRQLREGVLAKDSHDSPASSSDPTTGIPLPNLAWELRFSHPILVFSLQDDGNDLPRLSDAFPMTIQGGVNIMAYENVDIKSIHIEINVSGMSTWNMEGRRKGRQQVGDAFYFNSWKLKLCEAHAASNAKFGDSCTFQLDDENSQENTRRPESDDVATPGHVSFPPGSYSYSFETPVDCLLTHAEKYIHGDINWTVFAVMRLPESNHRFELRKELPVIQIPQLGARRFVTNQSPRQQNEGISFLVDLPYRILPIGGKIPITVGLGPVNNDVRVEYLTYSIVQRAERWTQDRVTRKSDEQKHVLLERFKLEESTTAGGDETDGEETTFSCESDASLEEFLEGIYRPNLDPAELSSISDDIILPTCRQMEAGWQVGHEPLELSCTTPFIQTKHFIQVTVGGSRPDPNKSGSRIKLEMTREIPITIIDCRITHRSDIQVDRMACDSWPRDNSTTDCGCPDADSFEESISWGKMPPTNGHVYARLATETSVYTREVYGGSEDDVRRKSTRLKDVWSHPIPGPGKPQHWEVLCDRTTNLSTAEHSFDTQNSDPRTAEDTSKSYGFTIDPLDEPPPYSD
ncbi:hypothetical protein Forpi1262_v005277 [Fusarium oxysporum f. sp. raphani]|uniref:Arrestin C-terminal-like domain-containing protein n=1 Tax=Fusarium oxysporum f. sp. raphani TaxID=96318 RepID=A0A8J5UAI4_FUSOX|nr:hypothetical protein Forpi1262_v005277 [Fusarium oxysporum f. sp. raphani]